MQEAATNQEGAANPAKFSSVDDFYRTYDNVMLRESEDNVRALASKYRPGEERERFLIRNTATLIVLATFEWTWWNIFQSQVRALQQLNTKTCQIEDLRHFFEQGKAATPSLYESRSFEVWLAFMRTHILILEQGESVQITVRGKEFLKYIIQCNYDTNTRIG